MRKDPRGVTTASRARNEEKVSYSLTEKKRREGGPGRPRGCSGLQERVQKEERKKGRNRRKPMWKRYKTSGNRRLVRNELEKRWARNSGFKKKKGNSHCVPSEKREDRTGSRPSITPPDTAEGTRRRPIRRREASEIPQSEPEKRRKRNHRGPRRVPPGFPITKSTRKGSRGKYPPLKPVQPGLRVKKRSTGLGGGGGGGVRTIRSLGGREAKKKGGTAAAAAGPLQGKKKGSGLSVPRHSVCVSREKEKRGPGRSDSPRAADPRGRTSAGWIQPRIKGSCLRGRSEKKKKGVGPAPQIVDDKKKETVGDSSRHRPV